MSAHMPYDVARYEKLKEILRRLDDDAGAGGLERRKVKLQGRIELLPIYRVQTEHLLFNKQNGRIHSEVLAREAQDGRRLDASSEDDQEIIRSLLLDIRADENEKISADLQRNGQIDPGIVTCDGVVINGNRRKVLLESLYRKTSDERYRFMEVQVLPSSVTRSEVWLIEAGIQMSTSQQLDYSPINNLLKFREGINSGINEAEMAARIYGATEEQIRDDLKRLELIDEYLEHYLRKPGRYYLVSEKSEHFINLQKIVRWLKHPVGPTKRNWDPTEADENELKLVAFQYIRDGFPHMRIRELRDLFCIQSSWNELQKSIHVGADTEAAEAPEAPTVPLEGDSEDDDENGSTPDLPESATPSEVADRAAELEWKAKHDAELKRNFERAKEQQQIDRDAGQPLTLARRALRNLDGIRPDSEGFDNPDLDTTLGLIVRLVNDLRSHFLKSRPRSSKPSRKKAGAKDGRSNRKSRGRGRRSRR
jgi:hypothetical protein